MTSGDHGVAKTTVKSPQFTSQALVTNEMQESSQTDLQIELALLMQAELSP